VLLFLSRVSPALHDDRRGGQNEHHQEQEHLPVWKAVHSGLRARGYSIPDAKMSKNCEGTAICFSSSTDDSRLRNAPRISSGKWSALQREYRAHGILHTVR